MTVLEIWLLAVGLAMDCLAVSIASGILLFRIRWYPILIMSLSFGIFQAIMPLLGWISAGIFSHFMESIDHWFAFFILSFLGMQMILESRNREFCRERFEPTNPKVILTMGVATSIDAFAIGISFAFLGLKDFSDILSPIAIIGFVSFAMSIFGFLFGIRFRKGYAKKLHAEIWGGVILILIGLKILIEHLFFK